MSDVIRTAAGIIIKDRKLLVARSIGKDFFIAPGGCIETGETVKQALVRELKEEFRLVVKEEDLTPFGSFSAPAANTPECMVHMEVFIVEQWRGRIVPDNEIEDIRWLTSKLPQDIQIGLIFAHEVIPRLKARGLIN